MNRQRIRRGLLVLTLTALAGALVAPTTAQAGTATKAGKDNPCQIVEQPKPKDPPTGNPKPKEPPTGNPKPKGPLADEAKAGNKGKDKDKDKDKTVGVLVCGDIAKISGKHRVTALTVKTVKGPVVVQVTRDTVVYKGDVKVPLKALTVGAPVAIKAELSKNGSIKAAAILLL